MLLNVPRNLRRNNTLPILSSQYQSVSMPVPGALLLAGDCRFWLQQLPANSVQCLITSPPYFGLRSYGLAPTQWADGWNGCLGLETTPAAYVSHLVEICTHIRRVLKPDGTFWLDIGDSYWSNPGGQNGNTGNISKRAITANQQVGRVNRTQTKVSGLKSKDLIGIPWMMAFALREAGWYLRAENIWGKPNGLPQSMQDRPTRNHEHVFLFTKRARYTYYKDDAFEPSRIHSGLAGQWKRNNSKRGQVIPNQQYGTHRPDRKPTVQQETKNLRSTSPLADEEPSALWWINTKGFRGAHFAVMPEKLAERCLLLGSRPGDIVLDPFSGSGTVGAVALQYGRRYIGLDANAAYNSLAAARILGFI